MSTTKSLDMRALFDQVEALVAKKERVLADEERRQMFIVHRMAKFQIAKRAEYREQAAAQCALLEHQLVRAQVAAEKRTAMVEAAEKRTAMLEAAEKRAASSSLYRH